MASIGSITCTFVHGHPPLPKQRVDLWRVPGLDGYGAQNLGHNDSSFQVTAIYYGDGFGLLAWKRAIEGLQGTVVTITNDLGIEYAYCLITKVSNMKNSPAKATGNITQRGEITVEGVVTD